MASPMAKGIWMALPATVFHFGPTISTVMLNPIMNRPIAPAALKGTGWLSMVQQSIDGRVDLFSCVDGWVDDELISQSIGQNEQVHVKFNYLCSCQKKKLPGLEFPKLWFSISPAPVKNLRTQKAA